MSKDNMEELRRHRIRQPGQVIDPCPEGEWVRFSDVEEREARFQARIEELKQALDRYIELNAENKARIEKLEAIVSGKTMYDAAAVADARWRERIQELIDDWPENATWNESEEAADAWTAATGQLRSLLDSGEQKECPACDGYGWVSCVTGKGADPKGAVDSLDGCPFCTKPGECGGSGHRATTPSPALEECTNCDGTGTRFSEVAWDDLTCGRCNGNKAVPAGSQEGKFGGPGGRRPAFLFLGVKGSDG